MPQEKAKPLMRKGGPAANSTGPRAGYQLHDPGLLMRKAEIALFLGRLARREPDVGPGLIRSVWDMV